MAKYIKTEEGYKAIEDIDGVVTTEQLEDIVGETPKIVKIYYSSNHLSTYNKCLSAYNHGDNLIYVRDGHEYEFYFYDGNNFYFREYDAEQLSFTKLSIGMQSQGTQTSFSINRNKIVNNLTTDNASSVLSAAQGVAIKNLIDAKSQVQIITWEEND